MPADSDPTCNSDGPSRISGEDLNDEILSALSAWDQSKDFHCFVHLPLELRVMPAMEAVEYNVSTGGWTKLLWNCFGTWPELIRVATKGYVLIGANEAAAGMEKLHDVLNANSHECDRFFQRATSER